jgi:hypothetical protein
MAHSTDRSITSLLAARAVCSVWKLARASVVPGHTWSPITKSTAWFLSQASFTSWISSA